MNERERFDTRFPPAAWSDPAALHRARSGGVFSWLVRQPLLLVGLVAMLSFSALRSPARGLEKLPDPAPAKGSLEEVQGTLAGLVMAQVRLERAAAAEPNPALASLILSVRDRYVLEIENLALAADALPPSGCPHLRAHKSPDH